MGATLFCCWPRKGITQVLFYDCLKNHTRIINVLFSRGVISQSKKKVDAEKQNVLAYHINRLKVKNHIIAVDAGKSI